MRAVQPLYSGDVDRDGVRLHYEVFGNAPQSVLLLPTWSIIHSRFWKAQVPYLSRHFRVVTFDGRGNGLSDRPSDARAYADAEFLRDAIAVMDATNTASAVVVGFSSGARWALILAAEYAQRVDRAVFIAPAIPLAQPFAERAAAIASFQRKRPRSEGWQKFNAHYWLEHYEEFLEFFFGKVFSEPHSTKQIEDCVGWGLDTDPRTLIATHDAPGLTAEEAKALCRRVQCPVLVIHGDRDEVAPIDRGRAVARQTGGEMLTLPKSGHAPHARIPVKVNLALRGFIEKDETPMAHPHRSRRKRALYISSPIGLGHAQRDVAIARELRKRHPDLQIDWLAQHPVTAVLQHFGERIHPASALLANEAGHIESEAAEHDLHCFQALRDMDEILIANFMVFHDVVRSERYDLWIGDEAWELDYFLHENPDQKSAPYVWMTDFVGWLPMPDGGEREAFVAADYNEEMIGHVAEHPNLRDLAIFVGNPSDIVADRFGKNLPAIRDWTIGNYSFAGYVTGFDPRALPGREAARAALGWHQDEKVCIVSAGGSGVGTALLSRVMQAYPYVKRALPEFRMLVVAGPRIDLGTLPSVPGVELRAFIPELYRMLAACDVAVVQGGLTTTMELTAAKIPFIYFPLRHHFEQNFHVRHRLNQYGAGRCMEYETSLPQDIAEAIEQEISHPARWMDVETDGASRAASLIASLL